MLKVASIREYVEDQLRRRKLLTSLVLMLPVFILLVVFFVVPLAQLLGLSVAPQGADKAKLYFSLKNYASSIVDPFYIQMAFNSMALGVCTTVATLLVSYPVAFYITRTSGWERTLISVACLLPLFVNVIVGILGWYILFLPYGIFQQALSAIGFIDGPLHILRTFPALVGVLTYEHIPFAVLILVSSLQAIPQDKLNAARILGAGVPRIFFGIVLPLTMPGLVASAVLVFSLSASSYLSPILIGAQRVQVLPLAIFSYGTELLNWSMAATLALILLVLVVVITTIFSASMDRLTKRDRWDMV